MEAVLPQEPGLSGVAGAPRRCLVTGCAGNVGSKLTRALLDRGHAVVGVDNFFSGSPASLEPFRDHPRFRFVERSVADPGLIEALCRDHGPCDVVFHLAAIVSVPWSMAHPAEISAINLEATRQLHAKARACGVGSFVFAGSAAEYGRPVAGPVREGQAGDPKSPYGLSKYLASRAIEDSGFGCSLRFFNLYGPSLGTPGPYDGVVRRFLSLALSGAPLTIHGLGSQTRDFVFIEDALTATMLAAGLAGDRPPLRGVYNIGTGRATSVAALAELIMALSGARNGLRFLPARAGDIEHSLAAPDKFLAATGFRPGITLDEGLGRTLDWLRARDRSVSRSACGSHGA